MNEKYKHDFLRAGELARQVRHYGKSLIVKGASYQEIIKEINRKIIEVGGRAAFPPQIALDHVAAHFLTRPDADIILSDEVVKLDIGVSYDGAIGDCAVTVDLSGKYQPLIDAVEAALLAAEQSIQVGMPTYQIGQIIEQKILSFGFNPIRNLCGHGLGRFKVHMPPSIPNWNDSSTAQIKPGMTFAVEPFATDGKGFVQTSGDSMIFSFIGIRPLHSTIARHLLAKIKAFEGLPFSMQDMMGEHPLEEIERGLNELIHAKVIAGYPPLVEVSNGIVAQAENSILVDEQGQVFITTR
jgi:methionyl aminopeptidase